MEVEPWLQQSRGTLQNEGILSEPPAESWPTIKMLCGATEFEPFKAMLDALAELSKTVVKVKGKTLEPSDLSKPVDTTCKKIDEVAETWCVMVGSETE